MQDSVSFCKQILIEYVLREKKNRCKQAYIGLGWSVRGSCQWIMCSAQV